MFIKEGQKGLASLCSISFCVDQWSNLSLNEGEGSILLVMKLNSKKRDINVD